MDAEKVKALFVAAGVTPKHVCECRDARRRSKDMVSWLIVLPTGARIPAQVWERIEAGAWSSGSSYVVQLKSA